MCQSRAQGGRRCAAHNRADELKRARNRISALSAQLEETDYLIARAKDDVEVLRDDARRAPDDEQARLNLELAERELESLERQRDDQRMDLECEQMVAGLTDVKERPGYRDDLLAALPEGGDTVITVEGEQLPRTAGDVADELSNLQKKAAAASGEAKRLRSIEDDEDAAALEEDKAAHFRERAAHLARTLRGALGDGVRIAADGIHAVGSVASDFVDATIGETLRGAGAAAVEMLEGAAQAAGVTAAVGPVGSSGGSASGSIPTPGTGGTSPDHGGGDDSEERDTPMTREERAIAREAEDARRIAADDSGFPDGWEPSDSPTYGFGDEAVERPAKAKKQAAGDPDDNPALRDEELSDDDLLSDLDALVRGKTLPTTRRASRASNRGGNRSSDTSEPRAARAQSASTRGAHREPARTPSTSGNADRTPRMSAHTEARTPTPDARPRTVEQVGSAAASAPARPAHAPSTPRIREFRVGSTIHHIAEFPDENISDDDLLSEIETLVKAS
ncbi:hypothetical protein DKM27_18490 [Mycobacterium tuberculosis variant bovis]|nr:hypothetical protein DKM27_18820 [Mycobacterium tuberculosis variant bovis]TXA40544.1 hypothetical protein DKM27_18490 [Mycobacterium tuberculosis variant bovis]